MRIEDGFYYKSGLVSDDFLDLLHEIDISPICFNCLVSHDWPIFCYEPLFIYCRLNSDVNMCPISSVVLLLSGYFDGMNLKEVLESEVI